MPLQALLSSPQTEENNVAVALSDKPVFATHESEETMQLQTSALAIGGRALAAAQSAPVAGQA
jgi:hypothetical protein